MLLSFEALGSLLPVPAAPPQTPRRHRQLLAREDGRLANFASACEARLRVWYSVPT